MSPLTIESRPDPGDPQSVFAFAMSFNGYEYYKFSLCQHEGGEGAQASNVSRCAE